MNITQIILGLFALAVVVLFFVNRSKAKKYVDDQISIIQDFNESDLEIESYVCEYQNLDSETLIELSKTKLREKRLKAIMQVLAKRDMTPYGNTQNQ